MFDWIAGFVARWAGRIGADILDVVHWSVHALAGVVYAVFGNVGNAWHLLWLSFHWLEVQTRLMGASVFGWIRQIITTDLPWLWHILLSDVKGLLAEIGRVAGVVEADLLRGLNVLRGVIDSVVRWVVANVYDPLKAFADQLRADLEKWGFFAWRLLNDPPKLAAILLGALIAAAESAFFSIAAPAGRFVLGLLIHNAAKVASLLESIVAAVL